MTSMKTAVLLIFASTFFHSVLATWNTLYDLESGVVYIHLSNDDVVKIPFDVTGKNSNISNGDQVTKLSLAPENSSLFLYHGNLYAARATTKTLSYLLTDKCGSGFFQLSMYNGTIGDWSDVTLDMSEIASDVSFYQDATYLSPFTSANDDSIYVYGGLCNTTSAVLSRLILLNIEKGTILNITTSTQPQAFYGAASLSGPGSQSEILIGGKTSGGWLSMNQLATWDFTTGWSLQAINTATKASVNLRKNALALPVFSPLSNDSASTIEDQYVVESVLLLGGTLNQELPFVSVLKINTNNWMWSNLSLLLDSQNILGAATIFNTLIMVNQTESASTNSKDVATNKYVLNLFDTLSFKQIESLQKNTDSLLSSKSSSTGHKSLLNSSQKVIISTIIPLISLAIIGVLALFFYRKRKSAKSAPDENGDYQFGIYGEHTNDTNSTIEAQSMDLWVRKRQEFDRLRNHNSSFLESVETLSDVRTLSTVSDPFVDVPFKEGKAIEFQPSLPKTLRKGNSFNSAYSNLNVKAPLKKIAPKLMSLKSPILDDLEEENDSGIDDQVDVQVLVSSKRRLILRVINPDLETIQSESEESSINQIDHGVSLRQRVPSEPKGRNL